MKYLKIFLPKGIWSDTFFLSILLHILKLGYCGWQAFVFQFRYCQRLQFFFTNFICHNNLSPLCALIFGSIILKEINIFTIIFVHNKIFKDFFTKWNLIRFFYRINVYMFTSYIEIGFLGLPSFCFSILILANATFSLPILFAIIIYFIFIILLSLRSNQHFSVNLYHWVL